MAGGTKVCIQHFGQQKATAFWNGTKHCPLQLRSLVPERAKAGWKTKIQKVCCPSFRYTEMVQESYRPFERQQCRSADTFGLGSARTPAGPAAHIHIPDTDMYLCRFHPHRRSFPLVYPWFHPDTLLLFGIPAPGSRSSFFLVILCRRRASCMPLVLHPNTSAISDWYASGCSSTYALSLSGSIFRKLLCNSFFSKFPVSSSCFFHFCIVDLDTLNIWCVASRLCPVCQYSIVRSLYLFE